MHKLVNKSDSPRSFSHAATEGKPAFEAFTLEPNWSKEISDAAADIIREAAEDAIALGELVLVQLTTDKTDKTDEPGGGGLEKADGDKAASESTQASTPAETAPAPAKKTKAETHNVDKDAADAELKKALEGDGGQ